MRYNKIYHIFVALAIALFFNACGSDAGFEQTHETIYLQENVPQEVAKGDRLVKEDENTIIRVVHELNSDVKTVVLLSGNAKLLRGSYETTR